MKIKLFGITADTIPDLISNIILFFVERNLSKLSLTRNDIMKFYYEIKLYMDNHDIFQ